MLPRPTARIRRWNCPGWPRPKGTLPDPRPTASAILSAPLALREHAEPQFLAERQRATQGDTPQLEPCGFPRKEIGRPRARAGAAG
eukprot:7076098-Alexandrium_andersonii.AAC.1